MKVYLLLQEQTVCVQGYEVGVDSYVLGAYSTRQKAVKAMYEREEEEDPFVDYRVIEREVM